MAVELAADLRATRLSRDCPDRQRLEPRRRFPTRRCLFPTTRSPSAGSHSVRWRELRQPFQQPFRSALPDLVGQVGESQFFEEPSFAMNRQFKDRSSRTGRKRGFAPSLESGLRSGILNPGCHFPGGPARLFPHKPAPRGTSSVFPVEHARVLTEFVKLTQCQPFRPLAPCSIVSPRWSERGFRQQFPLSDRHRVTLGRRNVSPFQNFHSRYPSDL